MIPYFYTAEKMVEVRHANLFKTTEAESRQSEANRVGKDSGLRYAGEMVGLIF